LHLSGPTISIASFSFCVATLEDDKIQNQRENTQGFREAKDAGSNFYQMHHLIGTHSLNRSASGLHAQTTL